MSEHVFFINSRAPDIQGLITGVEPGDLIFVRGPSGDDALQIADILAANDLTGLSSISIAGHGSSSIPPATSF
jgi:Domain of unknown function (DUF4347)